MFTLGLPPKTLPCAPLEVELDEGHLDPEPQAFVYGDGSGYLQQTRELRRASWSVVTVGDRGDGRDEGDDDQQRASSTMRGGIGGWFPTVPRGELSAMINFLRHAGPGARFVTDCQTVYDGVRLGVPDSLIAASSMNADLWRKIRAGITDRDDAPAILKTKAHRSMTAARRDTEDHLGHWWGNHLADAHAKELAHQMICEPSLEPKWSTARSEAVATLKRVAFGVAWALRRWPVLERRRDRVPADAPEDDDHIGHVLRRRADGAVECALCRRFARSGDSGGMGRLRREHCGGSILDRVDETHALRTSSGVTWCTRCGGFTSRWLRSLLAPCRGKPPTASRRNILRRLHAGLPPTAQAYLKQATEDGGAPAEAPDHAGLTAWIEKGAAASGNGLRDRCPYYGGAHGDI